jgi:hypothetical protein
LIRGGAKESRAIIKDMVLFQYFLPFFALLSACLSGWAIELQRVRDGRVILKAIVPLGRQLASRRLTDYVPETAAIVLISERHKLGEAASSVPSGSFATHAGVRGLREEPAAFS